jgi:hypothetical protein
VEQPRVAAERASVVEATRSDHDGRAGSETVRDAVSHEIPAEPSSDGERLVEHDEARTGVGEGERARGCAAPKRRDRARARAKVGKLSLFEPCANAPSIAARARIASTASLTQGEGGQ